MNKAKAEAAALRDKIARYEEQADLLDRLGDIFDDPRVSHVSTTSGDIVAGVLLTMDTRKEAIAYLRTLDLVEQGVLKDGYMTWLFAANGREDQKIGHVHWNYNTGASVYTTLVGFAKTEVGIVRVQVEICSDPAYIVNVGGSGGKVSWKPMLFPHGQLVRRMGVHPHFSVIFDNENEPGACTYEQYLGIEGSWEEDDDASHLRATRRRCAVRRGLRQRHGRTLPVDRRRRSV